MIRNVNLKGTLVDEQLGTSSPLEFTNIPEVRSASAEGSLGFKLMVSDALAIETQGTVYATDLDKKEIYLHYSWSAGLRILL